MNGSSSVVRVNYVLILTRGKVVYSNILNFCDRKLKILVHFPILQFLFIKSRRDFLIHMTIILSYYIFPEFVSIGSSLQDWSQ